MNERELMDRLEEAVPEVPSVFHNAMLGAFAQIQEQEEKEKLKDNLVELPKPRLRKRTAAIVLIAALLMATVATGTALMPKVVSYFYGGNAVIREDLPDLVQNNPVEMMVGNCRVRIEEVLYDGAQLYLTYSIRNMTVDRMMGERDPEDSPNGRRYLTIEEEEQEIYTWDAYLWSDALWINGEETEMLSGTFSNYGGDEPGEYISYNILHLYQEGIELNGETRIALPIGSDPRRLYEDGCLPRDENGRAAEPEGDACAIICLNADVPGIERIKGGPVTVWPDGTEFTVLETIFSPVRLHVAMTCSVSDELRRAYPEDMSDYRIVFDRWWDMALVDSEGNILNSERYEGLSGTNGDGVTFMEFTYRKEYPLPLYVAPVVDDVADMAHKVLIRE
ncbi:MAG: hypothetical protein J1E43_02270 [Christensenellaceae bacterium]|nr:hypothetical protein [Christensenellaceae bacterium]